MLNKPKKWSENNKDKCFLENSGSHNKKRKKFSKTKKQIKSYNSKSRLLNKLKISMKLKTKLNNWLQAINLRNLLFKIKEFQLNKIKSQSNHNFPKDNKLNNL
jgi:hypothetical protein